MQVRFASHIMHSHTGSDTLHFCADGDGKKNEGKNKKKDFKKDDNSNGKPDFMEKKK